VRPDRKPPGARWWRALALGVSLAIHSLLFLVVIHGHLPQVPELSPPLIQLAPPEPEQERTSPVRYYRPSTEQGLATRPRAVPPVRPEPVDTTRIQEPSAEAPIRDSSNVPRTPAARIGPYLGDGRLWVRPLPLPPRALAERLRPSHAELVDSAVTAIVQQYLDSIAREPGADRVELPDWTTRIAGSKFGLDGKNIYIAGLKIPAAVLALLPIPATGNQQTALDHNGQWIAEDLRRAAQRATTIDDFKRAVRELRAEKKRQRDLDRAQHEQPDSASAEEH
jgi:hypothetical protein